MPTEDLHLEGAEFLKSQMPGLVEPAGSKPLGEAAERSTKHNQELLGQIPYYQDWRTAANGIKDYAIGNLDKLLVDFSRQVEAA